MRVTVLAVLMSTDDAESQQSAEYALDNNLRKMLQHNYNLFAGTNGVPSARSQEATAVRYPPRVPLLSHAAHASVCVP